MFVICIFGAHGIDADTSLTAWRREAGVCGLTETATHSVPGAIAACFAGSMWAAEPPAQGRCDAAGRLYLFDGRLRHRSALQAALGLADASPDDPALYAAADTRWAAAAGNHLHGDYAALSWDSATATLRAVVDHACGLRLFYAATSDGGLCLATHLPLLLATPGVDRRLDGLALGIVPLALIAPRDTPFRAVELMPGGCTLQFRPGGRPQVSQWWQPAGPDPAARGLARLDLVEQLRAQFECAVAEHLDADMPMATMLSGGLDSTLVAGFAARRLQAEGRPLHAYTAVPHPGLPSPARPGWDASDWRPAGLLAARYPNIRHVAVHAGTPCLIDHFQRWHQMSASPVRNSANCQWIAAMAADAQRHGCRTLLGGGKGNATISIEHGDRAVLAHLADGALREVLVALRRADAPLPRQLLRLLRTALRPVRSSRSPMDRYFPVPEGAIAGALLDARRRRVRDTVGCPEQTRLRTIATGTVLAPDYRALHGITLRDPTVDRPLVELLLQLPVSATLQDGYHRALARQIGAGVVPDAIRWRTRRGQQSPEQDGYFRLHAEQYRDAWRIVSATRVCEWFDRGALATAFDKLLAGTAAPGQGAFMHRILDVGLFLDHAARRWGVDADLADARLSRTAIADSAA